MNKLVKKPSRHIASGFALGYNVGMRTKLLALAVSVAASLASAADREPVDWVNSEIGTISHLLVPCFRTVQLPNAMLRFLPPYRDFTQDEVGPFCLQHPAHRNPGVFACHPYSGPARDLFAAWRATWDQEHATPYSYDVVFDSCGVRFALVPAARSALATFTFTRADDVHAVVFAAEEVAADDAGAVRLRDTFRGRGNQAPVWLAGAFDAKPVRVAREGRQVAFVFDRPSVRFRYGVSCIGFDQAARNLAAGVADRDAASLAAAGRAAWNAKLGKIAVEGGTDDERTVFYTSLWRTYERMVNCTEDGRYRGWDGQVHATDGVDYYTDDWIWDSYRAQHPLMVILEPEAEAAKLTSYLRMAQQNREGWMPSFPVLGGDNHCMVNRHVAIAYYDAWVKGVRGFDLAAAFRAMDRTERTESLVPWYRGPLTALDRFHLEKGYFPALRPGEKETCPAVDTGWELRQAVSVTQGSSYDAWALAGIARALGDAENAAYYAKRAMNYANLWHPGTRFFRPKDADGNFIEPFDPVRCGGRGARNYFTENNAWTYIWDVQHNLPHLRELLGGADGMARRLDEMLNAGVGDRVRYVADMPDGATGMMGMFTMANEPAFHIPYLYNYAGRPHKTQKFVRKTLEAWFRNDRMGICGDEDGGGMCAYAVFSMMGFYPVTPGLPEYQIGSPVFTKVTIHLPGGRDFVLSAPKASRDAKYWDAAALDGRPFAGTVLRHADLAAGRTLTLDMHE